MTMLVLVRLVVLVVVLVILVVLVVVLLLLVVVLLVVLVVVIVVVVVLGISTRIQEPASNIYMPYLHTPRYQYPTQPCIPVIYSPTCPYRSSTSIHSSTCQ